VLDLPLLSWAFVLAALVIGILAGHFGWGKKRIKLKILKIRRGAIQ